VVVQLVVLLVPWLVVWLAAVDFATTLAVDRDTNTGGMAVV
jgi:hypothetical protein